jgi:hypothetical protein
MKIKALRSISGSYGHLIEGSEATVSDSLAKELIAAGLVAEVGESEDKELDAPKVHKTVTVTSNKKLK